jgi:hypothetical protein
MAAEKIREAVIQLHDTVVADSTDMSNALIAARQDANNVTAGDQAFVTDKIKAQYYAGKALGLNVWQCGTSSGQQTTGGQPPECVSHVNTVLNRRYKGTERRYRDALRDAQALGYMARRAIEQRIGVRLSDIMAKVGPLDPPSTWADDVCRLTGINYKRLSSFGLDAGAAAQTSINASVSSEFADAFVGDYVQKLGDFVQYYNVAYPEADGNDEAVLSLRETLLGGKPVCQQPSPNLLTDGSRLYAHAPFQSSPNVLGWTLSQCSASNATCLHLEAGTGALPLNSTGGGVSWLSDQPRPQAGDSGTDAGAADARAADGGVVDASAPDGAVDPANVGTIVGGPDNMVSQAVQIARTGKYLLSWWDQARDASGNPLATGNPVPYRVDVYDASWSPVGGGVYTPVLAGDAGAAWSNRHALAVPIAFQGVYHLAFAASAPGQGPGSVAIANVQLEISPLGRRSAG